MKLTGRKTVKGGTTSAPLNLKATGPAATATAAPANAAAAPAVTAAPVKRRAPSHDEIAQHAYEAYLARGAKPGDAVEDWLQAERDLLG